MREESISEYTVIVFTVTLKSIRKWQASILHHWRNIYTPQKASFFIDTCALVRRQFWIVVECSAIAVHQFDVEWIICEHKFNGNNEVFIWVVLLLNFNSWMASFVILIYHHSMRVSPAAHWPVRNLEPQPCRPSIDEWVSLLLRQQALVFRPIWTTIYTISSDRRAFQLSEVQQLKAPNISPAESQWLAWLPRIHINLFSMRAKEKFTVTILMDWSNGSAVRFTVGNWSK